MSARARPHPLGCLVLGWLVPGAGHLLLRDRRRGVELFLCVALTFAIGIWLTGGYAVSWTHHQLAFFLQVPAGLPTGIGAWLYGRGHVAVLGPQIPPAAVVAHLDLGLLFTMVAGLLNVLCAFDAYDRAASRREEAA